MHSDQQQGTAPSSTPPTVQRKSSAAGWQASRSSQPVLTTPIHPKGLDHSQKAHSIALLARESAAHTQMTQNTQKRQCRAAPFPTEPRPSHRQHRAGMFFPSTKSTKADLLSSPNPTCVVPTTPLATATSTDLDPVQTSLEMSHRKGSGMAIAMTGEDATGTSVARSC